MSFLKRRNRMVIFRVTEDEYENLKAVCSDRGARNLSDFARSELLQSIQRAGPPDPAVAGQLSQIDQKLSMLEHVVRRMAQLLERK
jgi:hypothetical protein